MIEHLLPATLGIGTDLLQGKDAWPDIPFARIHHPPIGGLVILVTILLGSTLPLLMIGRRIPEGRTPRCRTCGHDLTGIDSSNRCPECGEERAEGCIRTSPVPPATRFEPEGSREPSPIGRSAWSPTRSSRTTDQPVDGP